MKVKEMWWVMVLLSVFFSITVSAETTGQKELKGKKSAPEDTTGLAPVQLKMNTPLKISPDTFNECSVGVAANGDFVVAYSVREKDMEIYKRAFNADGTAKDDEEIKVNTFTLGNQHYPSVGVWKNGDYVIVWHSAMKKGYDRNSIVCRAYKADGSNLFDETTVMPSAGEDLGDDRQWPVVAVYDNNDPDDGFMIIGTETQHVLRACKMKKDGNPGTLKETPFCNHGWTGMFPGSQNHGIAVDEKGNAVIIGGDCHPEDPSTKRARYWIYDDKTVSFLGGPEGLVGYTNPNAGGKKENGEKYWSCDVAMNGSGEGVFVWMINDTGDEKGNLDIVARRFRLSGTTLNFLDKEEWTVNETTTGDQFGPRISIDQDGRFMVVWKDDYNNIYARVFGTNGFAAAEKEIRINQVPASEKGKYFFPDVAVNKGDKGKLDFVIVYTHSPADSEQKSLYAVTGFYDFAGD